MKDRRIIYALIITGIECGSMSSFLVAGDWEKGWRNADDETPESYAHITISDRYAEEGDCFGACDAAGPPLKLTDAALTEGWERFQKRAPKHYADAIAERDDALTGDAFLQILAFGDIVYG